MYITPEINRPNSAAESIKYRLFWVKHTGLENPSSFTMDRELNFYVVEKFKHRLVKIDKDGQKTVLAGTGQQGYNGDGKGASVHLNLPTDVTRDSQGNLYFTDTGNHLIRKITPDGMVQTIGGKYVIDDKPQKEGDVPSFLPIGDTTGDGKPALEAQVNIPNQITVDPNGVIYFTSKSNTIRMIKNGIMDKFAGSGTTGYNKDDFDAKLAHFNEPTDLAVGPDNLIYFIDSKNFRIRRVDPNGFIRDIAGLGLIKEHVDVLDNPLIAQIAPTAITLDPISGDLYLYDNSHRFLYRLDNKNRK